MGGEASGSEEEARACSLRQAGGGGDGAGPREFAGWVPPRGRLDAETRPSGQAARTSWHFLCSGWRVLTKRTTRSTCRTRCMPPHRETTGNNSNSASGDFDNYYFSTPRQGIRLLPQKPLFVSPETSSFTPSSFSPKAHQYAYVNPTGFTPFFRFPGPFAH